LAAKVRDIDMYGKIVFITTHIELSYLTFQHKIEAMDYIIKSSLEDIASRVQECIETAYKRYLDSSFKKECFQVKVGDEVRNIPLEDIMFFASHHKPHKLMMYTKNSYIEFYGSLSDVAEISPDFYRCHQSFVVNAKNIKSINKTKREVEMVNGEVAFVTAKKIKELQDRL
jgi:two-component system response regulator AgrA